MSSVTVAVVGAREIAPALGKKGTVSDLTLFNAATEGHQATIIEPTQYPEKYPPLLSAVAMADRVVFVVPGLTKEIGEIAATLDLLEPDCVLRHGPDVGEGELRRILQGSRLEAAPLAPLDLPALRQELQSWRAPTREGRVRVRLDHAFPVKGVGAVALGLVRQGVVRAHEVLRLYPTDREVEIRSIQVHDVDVKEAGAGSRVGLALKGIEADELSRGQVLAPKGDLVVGSAIDVREWRKSRYYRGTPGPGPAINVQVGLQFIPGHWERLEGTSGRIEFDRPAAWEPGDPVLVADLSAPSGPRSAGRALIA